MTYGVTNTPPGGVAERCTGNVKAAADLHSIVKPAGAGRPTGLTLASIADELTWFVLDLPLPPSINRIDKKLGNTARIVQDWIKRADKHLLLQKPLPNIEGDFELIVTWRRPIKPSKRRVDIDNPLKPLLDYLQRVKIIKNDRNCEQLLVRFGEAPAGCRVAVKPWWAA